MEDNLGGEIEELAEAFDELDASADDVESEDDVKDEESSEPEKVLPTATLGQLKKKQRVTKTVSVVVNDEETGDPVEVNLSFRSIPANRYDKIMSAYPPRPKDKKQGYGYNPDEFGPAIIAETMVDPEMTRDDVKEIIWESDDWNRGERMMLLMAAIEVCTAGLNVPFKKRVSG